MAYKSLLIHVEPTAAGRARLRIAVELARQFDARLVGLGARSFDSMPDPGGLSAIKLKEEVENDLAEAERIFTKKAAALGEQAQWRSEADYPTEAMLRHAACADLLIAGLGVAASPPEKQAGCADLIMGAGAPVLAIPKDATLGCLNVLIGWKNMRETRRAISDALPFLKLAQRVTLARFGGSNEPETSALDDAVARLRAHGVRAEGEVQRRSEGSVAEDLIETAARMDVDLIVAGGYGHSRLREWALGGVTQGLLQKSPRCVLFSH